VSCCTARVTPVAPVVGVVDAAVALVAATAALACAATTVRAETVRVLLRTAAFDFFGTGVLSPGEWVALLVECTVLSVLSACAVAAVHKHTPAATTDPANTDPTHNRIPDTRED
jgi:hypothetical protein